MGNKLVNLDLDIQNDIEIQNRLKEAIENGDSEEFAKVQIEIAKGYKAQILQEAKQSRNEDLNDREVMARRGLQPLTSAEQKYYNEVIGAGGFAGVQELVPATVFDRVFEELRKEHPLLNEIEFVNVTGVTEWVMRTGDAEAAWWGTLCADIQKKLENAFKKERMDLYKLSAWIPVCKAMLDLGPVWLDRFVREMLYESLAMALELAIVKGTGKDQPIGMVKNLAGAVVEGVYPDKDAVTLDDLSPASLGSKVMAPLTKGGTKIVTGANVMLVVNPLDYWNKIFPATAMLSASGTYVHGVLPIPAKIIQSVAVDEGKMVAGVAKDYFMGVGSNQVIEFSDHYKFLEDERTYISKQYANGKPKDNDSFIVFDVSELDVTMSGTPEV